MVHRELLPREWPGLGARPPPPRPRAFVRGGSRARSARGGPPAGRRGGPRDLPTGCSVLSPRVPRPVSVDHVAEERDKDLAREELSRHAARIIFHPDEHIRELAAKGKTYYLGQYVAAGALTTDEVREALEPAIRSWAERLWPGEDNDEEVERRLAQVFDEAIADGARRGPALPFDRATPKELLLAQVAEPVDVRQSADEVAEAARRIVASGRPAILALPPGVGKTRAALTEIARSRQDAVVYAPSHALAEEHRATLLALGVPASSIVHEMSPLHRPAGGEESCERSRVSRAEAGTPDDRPSPFAETVRRAHLNLRATVCPACPQRDTCPVRFPVQSGARIRLRVHAAYEPVEPGRAIVVLDEEPETHERLEVSPAHLRELTSKYSPVLAALTGASHAYWSPVQVERERARLAAEAALADEEVPTFDPGQAYYVRQAALALKEARPVREDILGGLARSAGTVRLSAAVARELAENPAKALSVDSTALEAVRAVVALASSGRGAVRRLDGTLEVISETATLRDTRRGWVRLLSATPTPGAYGDLEVFDPRVADGCDGVSREVLYLARSSTTSFKCDPPWEAIRRLLGGYTAEYGRFSGRVLLVTFKHVVANHAQTLEDLFPGASVETRWFGAVAGSNLFEEDASLEVTAIVTLGDYYANRRWLFEHLAIERGEDDIEKAISEAGVAQVAQELAQAHGRARDPRRTRPIQHVHLGTVLPLGWEGANTRTLADVDAAERADAQEAMLENLKRAVRRFGQRGVARQLGVNAGAVSKWHRGTVIPDKYADGLNRIARQ